MRRWYAVHTHSQSEEKATFHLRNQGYEVYLPRYRKRRRHARRTDWVNAALFPRYLFVEMDIEQERWRVIHSTFGVNHLVCQGDKPVPLPEFFVAEIKEREDESGILSLERIRPLMPGEKIRFMTGPMIDQVGVFDCVSDDERIFVLLDVLGRQVRIKAPLDSIAACA